ncbi:unnamed protein product [Sphagnum balticum]
MGIQADSISEMSDEEEDFRIHLLPSSVAFDDFQHAHLIPLIDLAALQQLQSSGCTTTAEKVVEQMASACREWGMFQIINHGVSQAVIDRCRASAASVFALPIQEKMKAKRLGDGSFHGYGSGSAVMKSDYPDIWSEAFFVMESPLPGDSSYYATKIWGPDGNTEFRDALQDYLTAMRKLMVQLMEALMIQGLGLNPEFVREYAECQLGLRLNFYKPCPEPAKHVGLPRHTDGTLMTILHQVDVGGLQVEKDGQWISVKPRADAFCVNIGDYGQILSNGLYKSAMHVAVVNESKTRLTLATGLFPASSLVVRPAPELIDDEHPPLFKSITADDFKMVKNKHPVAPLKHLSLKNSG